MPPAAGETRPTWCELDHHSLADFVRAHGYSPTNVPHILRSWYQHDGELNDWAKSRIGPRLAALLAEHIAPIASRVSHRHQSADGTVKLLIDLPVHVPIDLPLHVLVDDLPLHVFREGAGGEGSFSPQSPAKFAATLPLAPSRSTRRGSNSAECVLMPAYRAGRAMACVSSQIGCAMGCEFCASTKNGLERNLSAGEIVEQFVHLQREARLQNRRITSLVFMGMGEPMQNLAAVIPAIRRIADPDLGAVGWRQVTVSTVGIVPGIDELADADMNVHLALSLHAADDELRSQIVPMNRKYNIEAIMTAAKRFYDRTGRIVTIEWCLIAGVNDTDAQADALAALLRRFDFLRRARVNVIPFNPIGAPTNLRAASVSDRIPPATPMADHKYPAQKRDSSTSVTTNPDPMRTQPSPVADARGSLAANFRRPDALRVKQFIERLQSQNVVCHARDTRGDDVSAACGQLRRSVFGAAVPAAANRSFS